MTEVAVRRLNTARRLYASMSARAATAYALITQLRSVEIFVLRSRLVDEVANTVYFSNRYDACERYSDIREFKPALQEDMDEALTSREVDGVANYVLRPYFNPMPDIELPGARVWTLLQSFYARKELEHLAVAVYAAPPAGPVEGVSEAELLTLAENYRQRSLVLVNALRTLKTALVSAGTTVQRLTPAELGMTAEVQELLVRLEALTEMPLLPPTARWFGTDADRMNPLPDLPDEFVESVGAAN